MAGGAQILLKTAGVVPQGAHGARRLRPAAVARRLRSSCARAWRIDALLDTTPRGRLAQALPHAPAFMASSVLRARAARSCATCAAACASSSTSSRSRSLGDDAVERAFAFASDGRDETLAADHVLLHQGVVPDVNLARRRGMRARVERRCRRASRRSSTRGAAARCRDSTSRATGRASRAPKRPRRAGGSPRLPSPMRSDGSTAARAIAQAQHRMRALARAMRGRALPRRALPSRRRVSHSRRATRSRAAARKCRRRRSCDSRATDARVRTR